MYFQRHQTSSVKYTGAEQFSFYETCLLTSHANYVTYHFKHS